MNKRLMVTGCGGFVAGSVVWQAGREWELHALSRGEPLIYRDGLFWHSFDLLDTDRLRNVFREVNPDAVIHAAAIADIDYCESHKDIAEATNLGVTREIALLCRETGAKLVFLSTDTIFDGEKGNYREDDPPGPVNFYAETKVRAEKTVAQATDNSVVARLSLVVGLPLLGTGNSFLSRMIDSFREGCEVGVPDNEIRSPIDVVTLGHALLELAGNDFTGLMHLAGNDRLSRFAMAQHIAERLGYSRELVVAKDPSNIPGRARRPRDVSLDNSKARATLKTPMRTLDRAMDFVLSTDPNDAPMTRYVHNIVLEAWQEGADELRVDQIPWDVQISFRFGDEWCRVPKPPRYARKRLVIRMKMLAGLDIFEEKREQTGYLAIPYGEGEIKVQVKSLRSAHGESIVVELPRDIERSS